MVSYNSNLRSEHPFSIRFTSADFRAISGDGTPAINVISLRHYRWAAAMDLGIAPQDREHLERLDPCQTMHTSEEQKLGTAFRNVRCLIAFAALEASQRHLVVSIARRFAHRGLSHERLLLLAHKGLVSAITGFDPLEGRRLSSWAVWPITASLRAVFTSPQPELLTQSA